MTESTPMPRMPIARHVDELAAAIRGMQEQLHVQAKRIGELELAIHGDTDQYAVDAPYETERPY